MKKYIVIFSTLSIFILTNAFMFSSTKKIEKQFKKKFSLIEPNTTQAKEDSNAANAFYIMRQEVTNGEYKEFLDDLQNQGLAELVTSYSPDPQGWQKHHISLKPFDEHYFSHVAYRNYPVVNISHEAAQAYCDWLTKRHQHERHEGDLVAKFSLPQKSEWTAAATHGISGAVYAWGGASISNKQGCMLCNFGQAHEQTMPILNENHQITEMNNHSLDARYDDNASFTAPVNSYSASSAGLYCMNGNVAEMIATKGEALGGSWNSIAAEVTNQSVMNYTQPSPTVGFRVVAHLVQVPM